MANTLLITKIAGDYYEFVVNGDTANTITNTRNDLLAIGNQLHFKTSEGANLIKKQEIYPADVTLVASGTFTFTTKEQVFTKLIEVGFFDWIYGTGGGGGVDRFDELLDTFTYNGKEGYAVIVNETEQKLEAVPFYNVQNFTDLADVPSTIVPNKMVVTNSAGTALEYKDLPTDPPTYINTTGTIYYADDETQTTPLTFFGATRLKLTNDALGAKTNTSNAPYGVTSLWDDANNQIVLSDLSIGDQVLLRCDVEVNMATVSQKVRIDVDFAVGSVDTYSLPMFNEVMDDDATELTLKLPFDVTQDLKDYPSEISITASGEGTIKINGFYFEVLRKDINVLDITTTVNDATALVKGIVKLAGDLSGTADLPTVPALANKADTTYVDGKVIDSIADGDTTHAPSRNAVFDALAGKQDVVVNIIDGIGTTNKLPKFTDSNTLGDSQISDNGTEIGINTAPETNVLFKIKQYTNAVGRKIIKIVNTLDNTTNFEVDDNGNVKANGLIQSGQDGKTDGLMRAKHYEVGSEDGGGFIDGGANFWFRLRKLLDVWQWQSKGIINYFSDYSANYTARTLVDKGYVDSAIGAIPTNTSDLVNDGEDGINPFITALDLPSNLIMYMTLTPSSITGYDRACTTISDPDYPVATDVPIPAITTTAQLLEEYAIDAGVLLGNPGVLNIVAVGNIRKASGSGSAEFYFEAYHRDSLGVETLIATSNTTDAVTQSTFTQFSCTALWNNGDFDGTDRIVIKWYANRIVGGSDPNYEIKFGGTTPFRVAMPVPSGNIGGSGTGDMTKAVYDTDNDGVVDDSEKLGGQLPSYYAHDLQGAYDNGRTIVLTNTTSPLVFQDATNAVHDLFLVNNYLGTQRFFIKSNGFIYAPDGTITTKNISCGDGTINTICLFDSNKTIISANTTTYPNLTELAYLKGVTSAVQTQINAKAPLASPTFTGFPTAPTLAFGDSSGGIATTQFVHLEATGDFMTLTSAYVLSNSSSLQKMFNVGSSGNGSFAALANKTYEFEVVATLSSLTSASHNISFGFLGTATISSCIYIANAIKSNTTSIALLSTLGTSATATNITSTSNAQTAARMIIRGKITTTGIGTIIPSIATSIGVTGAQVDAGSFFKIRELGSDTVTYSATTNIN